MPSQGLRSGKQDGPTCEIGAAGASRRAGRARCRANRPAAGTRRMRQDGVCRPCFGGMGQRVAADALRGNRTRIYSELGTTPGMTLWMASRTQQPAWVGGPAAGRTADPLHLHLRPAQRASATGSSGSGISPRSGGWAATRCKARPLLPGVPCLAASLDRRLPAALDPGLSLFVIAGSAATGSLSRMPARPDPQSFSGLLSGSYLPRTPPLITGQPYLVSLAPGNASRDNLPRRNWLVRSGGMVVG